jgi:hypothetical protein
MNPIGHDPLADACRQCLHYQRDPRRKLVPRTSRRRLSR